MLDSTVLDVTIGLVLVYFVLSLFASAIKEWIARLLALRATGLRQGINELLADGRDAGLAAAIHEHPLIEALKPNKAPLLRRRSGRADNPARYPSYIASQTFALAVLDLTTTVSAAGSLGGAKATLLANLKPTGAAATTAPTPVPDVIKKVLADVNGDSALMRERLEQWFDESMQRVSGWYKRRSQVWLFGIGVVIAFALNADTLAIVKQLERDRSVREALVKQADAIVESSKGVPVDSIQARVRIGVDSLERAGLVFGWDAACAPQVRLLTWIRGGPAAQGCGSTMSSLVGLALTAIALSLGAPFWFDLLNKVSNLRQSGAQPARTQPR